MKIMPAQVPQRGIPARVRSRIASVSPNRSASLPMVVLSAARNDKGVNPVEVFGQTDLAGRPAEPPQCVNVPR